ncbi:MAG: hypothetical protein EZS28_046922, partial [Streblomastix strix]
STDLSGKNAPHPLPTEIHSSNSSHRRTKSNYETTYQKYMSDMSQYKEDLDRMKQNSNERNLSRTLPGGRKYENSAQVDHLKLSNSQGNIGRYSSMQSSYVRDYQALSPSQHQKLAKIPVVEQNQAISGSNTEQSNEGQQESEQLETIVPLPLASDIRKQKQTTNKAISSNYESSYKQDFKAKQIGESDTEYLKEYHKETVIQQTSPGNQRLRQSFSASGLQRSTAQHPYPNEVKPSPGKQTSYSKMESTYERDFKAKQAALNRQQPQSQDQNGPTDDYQQTPSEPGTYDTTYGGDYTLKTPSKSDTNGLIRPQSSPSAYKSGITVQSSSKTCQLSSSTKILNVQTDHMKTVSKTSSNFTKANSTYVQDYPPKQPENGPSYKPTSEVKTTPFTSTSSYKEDYKPKQSEPRPQTHPDHLKSQALPSTGK